MSTERKRRTSSLAGLTPVTAPPTPEPAAEAPAVQAPAAPVAPRPRPKAQGSKGSRKMNYYADEDQQGRIRAAYYAGRDTYGWQTLTDMQNQIIMQHVEQLEREFNGGAPFEPVHPGSISRGRPLE
ncbi:MAG: hypothetical protein GX678_06930 [Actinomycetales bacterium]|nr:hypothetical protein [Actinomycetales bacterium]